MQVLFCPFGLAPRSLPRSLPPRELASLHALIDMESHPRLLSPAASQTISDDLWNHQWHRMAMRLKGIPKRNLITSHHPLETLINRGLAACEVWEKNLTWTSHRPHMMSCLCNYMRCDVRCMWGFFHTPHMPPALCLSAFQAHHVRLWGLVRSSLQSAQCHQAFFFYLHISSTPWLLKVERKLNLHH